METTLSEVPTPWTWNSFASTFPQSTHLAHMAQTLSRPARPFPVVNVAAMATPQKPYSFSFSKMDFATPGATSCHSHWGNTVIGRRLTGPIYTQMSCSKHATLDLDACALSSLKSNCSLQDGGKTCLGLEFLYVSSTERNYGAQSKTTMKI